MGFGITRRGAQHCRVAIVPRDDLQPDRQRQGIGSAVIREGLARLKDRGERLVFVLGEPGYYGRFGFKVMDRFVSRYAGPYYQTLMLVPDAPAAGKVSYPQAFDGLG